VERLCSDEVVERTWRRSVVTRWWIVETLCSDEVVDRGEAL